MSFHSNFNRFNEKIDFERNFIESNFSFEKKFIKEDIFNKGINIKKIDFLDDKNEESSEIKSILSDLDKNININIKENENNNECQEIINILKKPLSDKNIRFYNSPFKPLLKPRKISMIGKVLCGIPNDEDDNTKSTNQNSSNFINDNTN
jgi:hypothetical protein